MSNFIKASLIHPRMLAAECFSLTSRQTRFTTAIVFVTSSKNCAFKPKKDRPSAVAISELRWMTLSFSFCIISVRFDRASSRTVVLTVSRLMGVFVKSLAFFSPVLKFLASVHCQSSKKDDHLQQQLSHKASSHEKL